MIKNKGFFFVLFLACCGSIVSQQVTLRISDKNAVFLEGKDSVLVYQKKPKSLNGSYARANYIHPFYSLDGVPITEDFPEDHLHHRGIFWAWHQLYRSNIKFGDAWEVRDFEWEIISASEAIGNIKGTTLKSEVVWKSSSSMNDFGETTPLVKETNWITVYPKKAGFRVVDIKIQLYPLFDTISIGGSEDEKGYGGFSARVQLSGDVMFKDSEGIIAPENAPVQGENWINIISKTSENNKSYGLVIMPSEENPGYPNPWILRSKESMQNAVYPHPGSVPVPLSKKIPLVLKYRLVVHHGSIQNVTLFELQKEYLSTTE